MNGAGAVALLIAFWVFILLLVGDNVTADKARDACYPAHGGVAQIESTTWSLPIDALVVCKDGTVVEL